VVQQRRCEDVSVVQITCKMLIVISDCIIHNDVMKHLLFMKARLAVDVVHPNVRTDTRVTSLGAARDKKLESTHDDQSTPRQQQQQYGRPKPNIVRSYFSLFEFCSSRKKCERFDSHFLPFECSLLHDRSHYWFLARVVSSSII
jgi:hypothetical protein